MRSIENTWGSAFFPAHSQSFCFLHEFHARIIPFLQLNETLASIKGERIFFSSHQVVDLSKLIQLVFVSLIGIELNKLFVIIVSN